MMRTFLTTGFLMLSALSFGVPAASAECIETGPTYGVTPEDCNLITFCEDIVGCAMRFANCEIDKLQGQECQ